MRVILPILLVILALSGDSQTKPNALLPKGQQQAAPRPKAATKQKAKVAPPAYVAPIFHEPIEWAPGATSVDLDCDGAAETVRWGTQPVTRYHFFDGKQQPENALEVVIQAQLAQEAPARPTKSRAQGKKKTDRVHIPFRKTTGYYGFCSVPKEMQRLELSCAWEGGSLPGCDAKKRCEALRITDECSEFLVFWDQERDALTWIRPSRAQ
jgi:hypothetical protein